MSFVESFVADLQGYRSGEGVFNPWADVDLTYDAYAGAPAQRSAHLRAYLAPRLGRARYILVAEAVSYQGGRFTGIAMTSERILLGLAPGMDPNWVLPPGVFRRTSRADVRPNGFAEPTATIVWSALRDFGVDPHDVILWNAFPFHTYKPAAGGLSNRTPAPRELADGALYARSLILACPGAQVIAVGAKSAELLGGMGIASRPVRHPANGGAPAFRAQFAAILREGEALA